jgi:hypothetical protein
MEQCTLLVQLDIISAPQLSNMSKIEKLKLLAHSQLGDINDNTLLSELKEYNSSWKQENNILIL